MTAARDAGEVVRYDYTPHPAQARAHAVATDELFYGGAAGGGKALPLDTPIPTPTGWTTMGALTPGDRVLGMDGRPTTVTRATGVMHGHDVYRVVFDDGATVYADADHQWLTYTAADLAALTRRDPAWQARRRASRPRRGTGSRPDLAAANAARAHTPAPVTGGVRTTRDILDTLTTPTGRRNHAIPLPAALDLPHADLPVDPYVLGAWLGDGHSAGGAFTTADQWLVDELRRRGQTVTKWASRYGYGLPGLLPQLRALGVLGNKHIPAAYLRASKAQRLALMQGIVDTDGHVSARGKVEVTLTRAVLARDVHELALTLGVKATIRESRATLNGRDAGPRWRICWTSTERTALMPRKADRLPVEVRRSTGWRFIVAVEPVPSVPVRCIQVDADDALFLAGRDMVPTHNSRFGRALAVLYALRFPGIKVIIFRRTFPQLRDAVEQPMRAELPPGLATYNKTDHTFTFRNGSMIQLGYLRHETDVENYQGAEWQLVIFEEVTHFTESQYLYMKSRLRAAGPVRAMLEAAGLRPRIVSTGNPGSIGHLWVKARFVDPAPPGTVFRVKPSDRDRNPGTRVFIPARATDNPSLNPEYIQELDQLPPDLRAALRDGDWDRLSGVRFESWDRAVHVIRPEDLPLTPGQGLRAVGVDYGSSAPFAALWGCKLSDDLVVIYRELYLKGLTPRQQAEAIRAAEAEAERIPDARPIPIALDPSTWARAADKPLAQVRNGIPPEGSIARAYHDVFPGQVVKAWNERVAGWALLDEHLRVRDDGLPRLLVYNTCTNLIRTLPALPRDARRPEDINTKAEDHAADSLRYLLAQLAGKHRADPDRPAPPGSALAETADLRTRAW